MAAPGTAADAGAHGRRLVVHAGRCVHAQVLHASCQACVDACPRQAWRLHPEGLGLDAEACDDCGLCVAACPTDALQLPAPTPRLSARPGGARTLLLACARAGVADAAGRTPCLYGLSPGWLLRAAEVLSADAIALVPGDCANCPRGAAGPAWRGHWLEVAERLRLAGRAVPALSPLPATAWPAPERAAATPAPARRRLLGVGAAPGHGPPAALPPLAGARAWSTAQLFDAAAPSVPLWAVTLDSARCTWCLACTRLCPSGALALRRSDAADAPEHLVLDMRRCTGCGLCGDVCAPRALSAPYTPAEGVAATGPQALPLERKRCPACRVEFHRPAGAQAEAAALCHTCRQGRPRQHNRLVQQDSTP